MAEVMKLVWVQSGNPRLTGSRVLALIYCVRPTRSSQPQRFPWCPSQFWCPFPECSSQVYSPLTLTSLTNVPWVNKVLKEENDFSVGGVVLI